MNKKMKASAIVAASLLSERHDVSPPCRDERRALRNIANVQWLGCPVGIVGGNAAPRLAGESHHYVTKAGDVIVYPNAYAKKGWRNMSYVASTLRVEVGAEWLVLWRLNGGVFAWECAATDEDERRLGVVSSDRRAQDSR